MHRKTLSTTDTLQSRIPGGNSVLNKLGAIISAKKDFIDQFSQDEGDLILYLLRWKLGLHVELGQQLNYSVKAEMFQNLWKEMPAEKQNLLLNKVIELPENKSIVEKFIDVLSGKTSFYQYSFISEEKDIPKAQKKANISNDPQELIQKLGDIFDTKFEDGTKTRFVLTTIKGLEEILGKAEILKVINNSANNSPNTNKTYDNYTDSNQTGIIKNGYLVNIDLFQQVALLAAIEQKTGVKNKIGFYNLNGSMCVHQTDAAKLWDSKQIGWFWTGEVYTGSDDASTYSKPEIIYLSDKKLQDGIKAKSCFCYHRFSFGDWGYLDPGYYNYGVALVLGLIF